MAGSAFKVPPSLRRYRECDVLQKYSATLNEAIDDPQTFYRLLVANQFVSKQSAKNKINVTGVSDYKKVGDLLDLVDSRIKTAGVVSHEKVTEKFKLFLSILSNDELGQKDVAEQMEAECYGSKTPSENPKVNIAEKNSGGGINLGSIQTENLSRIDCDSGISPNTGDSHASGFNQGLATSSETLAQLGGPSNVLNLFPSNRWKLGHLHSSGVRGSTTKVAVLDSGVYADHLSLSAKVSGHVHNYVPDNNPTGKAPSYEHGTQVAAVIGGQSYEGFAGGQAYEVPVGVAPDCELMVCRITPDNMTYYLENALRHLCTVVGLDIVCMSFSIDQKYDTTNIKSYLRCLRERGVICIAAAGNEGEYQSGPNFPASDENVLSVGALKPQGRESDINTSRGIDVYAHGEQVIVPLVASANAITEVTGTSFAAPMVAGFLSLLIQLTKEPSLYAAGVPHDMRLVTKKYHDLKFLKDLFAYHKLSNGIRMIRVQAFLQELIDRRGENYLVKLVREINDPNFNP